jgi:hypothetical protein
MPATAGKYGAFDSLTPSGREKSDASDTQKELARLTARIAGELYDSTAGIRGQTLGNLGSFLQTGELPVGLAPPTQDLYRTGRENIESQYLNARDQILNQTPVRGGEMNTAMRALAMQRAGDVGRLQTDIRAQVEQPIRNQLFSAALGTAFGAPPQAMAGLNLGATQFGNVANRALGEQLHREDAAKGELQQIGQMIVMAAGT